MLKAHKQESNSLQTDPLMIQTTPFNSKPVQIPPLKNPEFQSHEREHFLNIQPKNQRRRRFEDLVLDDQHLLPT